MAKAPKLTALQTTLDLVELAKALRLTPEEAQRKFRDGRVTSWFAEIWGQRLFGYTAHAHANVAGSDALIALGAIGDVSIGVRCLTAGGIKFQKSSQIGSGRSSDKERLRLGLAELDRYVVVDIRDFPKLTFFPVPTTQLLQAVEAGRLTLAGFKPGEFLKWAAETFTMTVTPFVLKAS